METFILVFLVTSVLVSGVSLGLIVPFLLEAKRQREELKEKVREFAEITKIASDANTSQANKLLQLEDKVANFEFWKQANLQSNFKVK